MSLIQKNMSDAEIQRAIDLAVANATADLKRQIDELTKYVSQFETASQVDPNVKRTLGLVIAAASGKVATSEDVAVNEAGAATHNVLGSPDKFIKIGDANVPAWNS